MKTKIKNEIENCAYCVTSFKECAKNLLEITNDVEWLSCALDFMPEYTDYFKSMLRKELREIKNESK